MNLRASERKTQQFEFSVFGFRCISTKMNSFISGNAAVKPAEQDSLDVNGSPPTQPPPSCEAHIISSRSNLRLSEQKAACDSLRGISLFKCVAVLMVSACTCSPVSTPQVSNGAEQPRKQQRSDLNIPLENNNVPEVRCCCCCQHASALLQGHLHFKGCSACACACACLCVRRICATRMSSSGYFVSVNRSEWA